MQAEDEQLDADEAEAGEVERELAEATADADAVEQDTVTAHAASATADKATPVPQTDAGIRRIRDRWQRSLTRARENLRRRRGERADRADQRHDTSTRRRRMRSRKGDSERRKSRLEAKRRARKRQLARRREQLHDHHGARATATTAAKAPPPRARAAGVGDVIDSVVEFIKKLIAKLVAIIARLARLIAALIRAIARLIKAIARATRKISWLTRLLRTIVGAIKRTVSKVARFARKLANPRFKPFGFDRTGPPPGAKGTRHVEGVVFREEGVDMWPEPRHSGAPLGRLAHGRKLFVLDKNLPGGWAHVTTDKGSNGYVPSSVVKTDLPCPGARLYRIPGDTTALAIAQRFFGDQVKPGRDLRFYVNVLQYVNGREEGRAGIERAKDSDSWKDVKAYAGFSIWIPTAEFANTLAGVVDDGSITNGLWARAKGAFNAVVDILIGAPAFVYGLLKGVVLEVKDILVGLADLVGVVIDLIKSLVSGELISDLKALWDEFSKLDIKGALGSAWREFSARWNDSNPMDRWAFRGEVVGRVATEVVLTVFTGGVAAVVSGTSKFARLTAAVSKLRSVQRLEKAARANQHRVPAIARRAQAEDPRPPPAGRRRHRGAQPPAQRGGSRQRHAEGAGSGGDARRARAPRCGCCASGSSGPRADHDARDIRVDQAQVGAAPRGAVGNRLGNNRPDLQYTDAQGTPPLRRVRRLPLAPRSSPLAADPLQRSRRRRRAVAGDPLQAWRQMGVRVRQGVLMVGPLDGWHPVTGVTAFFEAEPESLVSAWEAQAAKWGRPASVRPVEGEFPAVLRALEPFDGSELMVSGAGLVRGLPGRHISRHGLARSARSRHGLGCRSVYARSLPNQYGRGRGANVSLQLHDPSVSGEPDGFIRLISLGYAESGWDFVTVGESQPWEDLSAYKARRKADRFPPELLLRYLDAIGIPPLDGPGWGPGGVLFPSG